jgi:hypothetical protein
MSAKRHESSSPCNGAPQGGPARRYERGNNTAEGRGNKAAEDDNEGRDNVLRHEGEARAKPKGVATRLRKTTHGDDREGVR